MTQRFSVLVFSFSCLLDGFDASPGEWGGGWAVSQRKMHFRVLQQRWRRPKSVRNQPESEVRHKELGTEVKKIAEINRKKIAEINPVGGFRSK